jgi:TatD DNase family protein
MELIDTHTHLDNSQLDADRAAVFARMRQAGVGMALIPNVDDESWPRMTALQAQYPEAVRLMLGLHPCHVGADWTEVLDRYEALWTATPEAFVAVGELGLDLYWDKTTLDWQVAALERQLEWCLRWDKPFSMHVREAWGPTMDVLRAWKGRGLRGVLHCFTGSREIAAELIDMGLHLGIGGVATFPKAGVVDVLRETGLDRVVLETDSPYLAPVPFRGKRNESAYVRRVAEHLAAELGIPLAEVANVTTRNARHIFGL